MSTRFLRLSIDACVIVLAVAAFLVFNSMARSARSVPPPDRSNHLYHAKSEQDVYAIYKELGMWGAKVLHFNQHFNMLEYFPKKELTSTPFPIRTYDIRPSYEKGLDPHSWLFIAARTGLVRYVVSVLPDRIYRQRREDFLGEHAYTVDKRGIRGYSYEAARLITTIENLPRCTEPVVVSVDAGYFAEGADPGRTASMLRERCPDVRMLVLVQSVDKDDVTPEMRRKLKLFEEAWER